MNQQEQGLYQKFNVTRTDGTDAPGGRHEGDEYFVLNLTTDKHAIPAIAAYAESCAAEYPVLASDLLIKIAAINDKQNDFITTPEITLPCGTVVPSFELMTHIAGQGIGGLPVSNIETTPWVNVSYFDAMAATEKAGYKTLTALQAQAVSFDIYNQPENWLSGQVGVGELKRGLYKETVSSAQPGTYVSPDAEEDRWFVLSNGARIQDWSGNAFQWMYDNLHGDDRGLAGKIPADSPLLTTCPLPSMKQGTGWRPDGERNWSGDALIRGGCWCSVSHAGVFYLGGGYPGYRNVGVGFRCTKSL